MIAGIATGNPILCGISIGVLTVGIVLLLIWALHCAAIAECATLQGVIQTIEVFLAFMALIAVFGLVLQDFGCGVAIILEAHFWVSSTVFYGASLTYEDADGNLTPLIRFSACAAPT